MSDVVVVGGGVIGCATAVFLLRGDPGLEVTVVEPDPTYAVAASPRASGGIRQLFSCQENIQLSRYTLDFIDSWPDFADTDLGWRPNGYLFVASSDQAGALRENLLVQQEAGVPAFWLAAAEVADRYPLLATEDLGGAVLSPDDGWLDPYAFLMGFRRAAQRLGARFVRDRVVNFIVRDRKITAVDLASGDVLPAGHVVNAAGCWSAELAARVGLPIPVEPMRRYEHFVRADGDFSLLPFIKDPAGLAVRPAGDGLSVGLVDFTHPGGFDDSIDSSYFDTAVWPALAHRLPRWIAPGCTRQRSATTTRTASTGTRSSGPGRLCCGISPWPAGFPATA